jgi:hypothetical protein
MWIKNWAKEWTKYWRNENQEIGERGINNGRNEDQELGKEMTKY